VTNSDTPPTPKPLGGLDPGDPRVVMAAERTLLAWVRTGLALMGFGFVVARFGFFLREIAAATGQEVSGGRGHSLWLGVALVLIGVCVMIVSALQHHRYTRALASRELVGPPNAVFGLVVAAVLAILGLAMAWYLLMLS
jgi:putative membrane protein